MRTRALAIGLSPILLVLAAIPPAWADPPSHGISHFGGLKYPKDFPHFDYVNPDAPKGGRMRTLGILNEALAGTFNNLHPFVDKGTPVAGWERIYDTLMRGSEDELSSTYGCLAETIEVADDCSWVAYTLRQNAYWHDGEPITVEDMIWTFNTIKTEGSVGWKNGYRFFDRMTQTGPWCFRIYFTEDAEKNRKLVMQTTGMRPLPKHYWENRKFNATTLDPPLGSGPYRIKTVDPGHRIVYERVENYWGKDLNVNVGHNNFDEIEYIYFFDKNLVLQALKANLIDYKREFSMADYSTAYNFWGRDQGLFVRERLQLGLLFGMNEGISLNTRLEKFSDVRVREALTLAYNFDWANRVLSYDARNRNISYFVESDMASSGLPSAAELELLEPFRGQIPDRVFTDAFTLPVNEPYGRNRDALQRASALLDEAGWVVKDFVRVNEETGEPFMIEFLTSSVATERLLTPYVDTLARLGISARICKVEVNQVVNRLRKFDFEARIDQIWFSNIPVSAWMRSRFLSRNADVPYMTNLAGVRSPAVDFLVEKILSAPTEEDMNTAGHALDRVLLWSFYMIPGGYPKGRCFAYWDKFGTPSTDKMNWNGWPHLWWLDEEKNARVEAAFAARK